MNKYEIASVVLALRFFQRVCPMDTYEQRLAHDAAFSTLWLLPLSVRQIVEEMEDAA